MSKISALYPGSFDPITRGHEYIISEASKEFELYIGVAINPGKSATFALQERVRLIQHAVQQFQIHPNRVTRIAGSTARWMQRSGIDTITRGQRDIIDELDEKRFEFFNQLENPDINTHIITAHKDLQFASSSAAKMLVKANHNPASVVSMHVQEALTSRLLGQYPVYIAGGMGAGKSTVARGLVQEAQKIGINIKHIELDSLVHEIYTSLTDPIYRNTRLQIQSLFAEDILIDNTWIDRAKLADSLKGDSGIDTNKLAQLENILKPAIEFRYKDMIEGFQGIIIIDGLIKEGFHFAQLAHNNVMFVDASMGTRMKRVKKRYKDNNNPKTKEYIQSIMNAQLSLDQMEDLIEHDIAAGHNGNIEHIENNESDIDSRKVFFQLLNQIDRYGDLRATYILSLLGIEGSIREHLNFLQSKYNEQHRYYHSWEHIVESLNLLFEVAIELDLDEDDLAMVGGAILGHDLVYQVDVHRYPDNELMSQKTWSNYLEKHGVTKKKIRKIGDLILETRHGRVKISKSLSSHLLHDIDMAIIGSDPVRYAQYVYDIRSEFASMLSGKKFEELRRDKFLNPVLEKGGDLFMLESLRDRFASRAMKNIKKELTGTI